MMTSLFMFLQKRTALIKGSKLSSINMLLYQASFMSNGSIPYFDAAVMTLPAHLFAGEERGDDFLHHARTEAFFPKRKHVGVVVITGIFGAIGLVGFQSGLT